jgi:hypothetical protein
VEPSIDRRTGASSFLSLQAEAWPAPTTLRAFVVETVGTSLLVALLAIAPHARSGTPATLADVVGLAALLSALIANFGLGRFHPLVSAVADADRSMDRVAARIIVQLAAAMLAGAAVAFTSLGSTHNAAHEASLLVELGASFLLVALAVTIPPERIALRCSMLAIYVVALHQLANGVPTGNSAFTIARAMASTVSGQRPTSIGPVIGVQLLGAMVAIAVFRRRTSTATQ